MQEYCMETSTIQVSSKLKKVLDCLKLYSRETYNDVIERLVEDEEELNGKTREEIRVALAEYKRGEYTSHADLKKELGF